MCKLYYNKPHINCKVEKDEKESNISLKYIENWNSLNSENKKKKFLLLLYRSFFTSFVSIIILCTYHLLSDIIFVNFCLYQKEKRDAKNKYFQVE